MEDFLKIKWSIEGPHELEHEPAFIPEHKIYDSYVYSNLEEATEDIEPTATSKVAQVQVPGLAHTFKCPIKSYLSKLEQQISLKGLGLLQAGKKQLNPYEQNCVQTYNNLQQKIVNENAKYLQFVRQQFQIVQRKYNGARNKFKTSAMDTWMEKLNRCVEYAQLYKDIDMLSCSYDEDGAPIEMTHIMNLLELGTVAKFNPPSLVNNYLLKMCGASSQNGVTLNSKLPVSKDNNIDTLYRENKFDIVISSGALKRLMDFTDVNCVWNIPVIVKTSKTSGIDSKGTKPIVFVDKPLPKQNPSIEDFNEQSVKLLLKTNFCNVAAFSFPNQETPIVESKTTSNLRQVNICTPGNLTDRPEKSFQRELVSYSDLWDSSDVDEENFKKINLNDDTKIKTASKPTVDIKSKTSEHNLEAEQNSVHHNVSYRLWKLHQRNEQSGLAQIKHQLQEIKVLVRCKLDGCEISDSGVLQPVTVVPKLEYQLKYGGSVASRSELVKQWTSVYFRPYSQLYRVRTHFTSGEIIMVENCNIQKINNEAQIHYEYKPRLGLGVLYKVFIELMKLEPGNYLLRHVPKHGPFVSLLKETEENSASVYNLHRDYDVTNCKTVNKLHRPWCPIDVNLILPRHRVFNEMPGLFKPSERTVEFTKKRKGVYNNTKKKNKKKKSTAKKKL